jgi:hypothetical protein
MCKLAECENRQSQNESDDEQIDYDTEGDADHEFDL